MEETENRDYHGETFSKAVRAGKRTYFFDVKTTRANDLYLTITESKREFSAEGEKPFYKKHKIFLYKEDFEKFADGLNEAVTFIRNNVGIAPSPDAASPSNSSSTPESSSPSFGEGSRFSNIDYDDLGEKKEE